MTQTLTKVGQEQVFRAIVLCDDEGSFLVIIRDGRIVSMDRVELPQRSIGNESGEDDSEDEIQWETSD